TIEAYDDLLVRSISVDTQTKDHKQWQLKYTAFVEGSQTGKSSGKVEVFLDHEKLGESKYEVQFHQGEANITQTVAVPEKLHIKAWFPNGVGEPSLYK